MICTSDCVETAHPPYYKSKKAAFLIKVLLFVKNAKNALLVVVVFIS